MLIITSKQKQYLKSLAHKLKPIVMVGKDDIDDKVLAAVNRELENHELIKVKLLDSVATPKKEAAQFIAEKTKSTLVSVIGRTLILYKPNPEKIQVRLPR